MTAAYTFRIQMTVSVFAENPEQAQQILDQHGGYVQQRDTELAKVTNVQLPAATVRQIGPAGAKRGKR